MTHRSLIKAAGALATALAMLQVAVVRAGDLEVVTLPPLYAEPVDPVAQHLASYRWSCSGSGCADDEAIHRLASSMRKHGDRLGVPVRLLVGIAMVEDPWLDTLATSRAGAVGIFQVMPMHRSAWPNCEEPLQSIEGSTCRGAEIIADFLRRSQSEAQALLRYNGCRQRYCSGYPHKVNGQAELFGGG